MSASTAFFADSTSRNSENTLFFHLDCGFSRKPRPGVSAHTGKPRGSPSLAGWGVQPRSAASDALPNESRSAGLHPASLTWRSEEPGKNGHSRRRPLFASVGFLDCGRRSRPVASFKGLSRDVGKRIQGFRGKKTCVRPWTRGFAPMSIDLTLDSVRPRGGRFSPLLRPVYGGSHVDAFPDPQRVRPPRHPSDSQGAAPGPERGSQSDERLPENKRDVPSTAQSIATVKAWKVGMRALAAATLGSAMRPERSTYRVRCQFEPGAVTDGPRHCYSL
jgi:hypothetical protein